MIELSGGVYRLESRQCLTTIVITIAGICYLLLYAQVHGESPFSSFSSFISPQSPGLRMLQWWVCGLSISIAVSGIWIPSERVFECHPDQSNRFYGSIFVQLFFVAWVVDVACFSHQVDWNEQFLCLLFCIVFLSLLTLLFLLMHYSQFSSSSLVIPIMITNVLICFCVPGLIRSFHRLLPSLNILSSASSFPLYILFHDLLPLPFLRILSLGKKIFDLVYFVKDVPFLSLIHYSVLILFVELLAKFVSFLVSSFHLTLV